MLLIVSIMFPIVANGVAEEGPEEITLVMQDYFSENSQIALVEKMIVDFEADHPGVTIERRQVPFDKLNSLIINQALAKDVPDILMVNNFDVPLIYETNALRSLNSYVNMDFWSDFFQGSQEVGMMGDDIYTIHMGTNNLALFYNTEMFAKAGLTRPPETWVELMDYCEKLTTDDHYAIAFAAPNDEQLPWQFKPFLWTNGADLEHLDTPEALEALQLWVDMVDKGYASRDVVTWGQGDLNIQFETGKAAMIIMGPWAINGYQACNVPFEICPIPTPEAGMAANVAMGGETFGISNYTSEEKAELAWDFIYSLVNDKNMKDVCDTFGYIPTRKSVVDAYMAENPIMEPFLKQLSHAKRSETEKRLDYAEVSTIARAAFQNAILGNTDPAKALNEAAELIRNLD